MFINFVWQVFLFLICMAIAHSCWVYVQENILKKNTEFVTPKQVEKYEKIIEELNQQKNDTDVVEDKEKDTQLIEQELGDYVNSLL